MDYEYTIVKKEDRVATIALNRPDILNAFSPEMCTEIAQVCRELAQDNEVGAVIVTGAGRAFSAGGDFNSGFFTAQTPMEEWWCMQTPADMIMSLRALPKPVIAAVNGVVAGGGCGLILGCDIIIASDKARFGMAFIQAGVHPDTGSTYFLPRLVGVNRALEFFFTGKMIDANEAERIGLINRVVPADKLESEARELAKSLAEGPPRAISMIKNSVYQSLHMDLPAVLEWEAKAQCTLCLTEDSKEAVAAFRGKRKPVYKGK